MIPFYPETLWDSRSQGNRYHNGHAFRIGDICSRDFGIIITGMQCFSTAERDISFQSIPGRSGDLAFDNKRLKNLEILYSCAIPTDFRNKFDSFTSHLYALSGYQRIEDTTDADTFRLGIVCGDIQPTVIRRGKGGTFELKVNCKPQRFLKAGEEAGVYNEPVSLYNHYGSPARPIIKVYGTGPGDLFVGDCIVEIKKLSDHIILECEMMDAYRQIGDGATENKNADIYAPVFPELKHGETAIRWSGGITGIEIIPRWWRV